MFQTTHISKSRKFFVFTVCKNRFDTYGEGRCRLHIVYGPERESRLGSATEEPNGTWDRQIDLTLGGFFTSLFFSLLFVSVRHEFRTSNCTEIGTLPPPPKKKGLFLLRTYTADFTCPPAVAKNICSVTTGASWHTLGDKAQRTAAARWMGWSAAPKVRAGCTPREARWALGLPCAAHGRPAEPYSTVLWLENLLLALRAVGRVKCLQQEWEQVGLARCGIMVLRKRNRFPAPSQSPNNV